MHLPRHLVNLRSLAPHELEERLERQMARARGSKYYSGRFRESDSFESVAPTTKQDLRSGYPFDFLATPIENVATYHESSGTTGTPSVSFYSSHEWDELALRFDRKPSEIVPEDIFLIRIPYAFVVAGMLADACGRRKGATVIAGGSRTLAAPPSRAARVIKDLNVTKTWSSPTEILLIAAAMTAQGMTPSEDAPHLRNIFLGGEALPPAKQRYISELWGHAHVAQEFGCTEAGSLAGSWPDGSIRWWSDVALAEVLDDDGRIRRSGTGKLLVTPLLREAMPLLRYETGDRVVLGDNDENNSFPEVHFLGRESAPSRTITPGAMEEAFYNALSPDELVFWRASVGKSLVEIQVEPAPGSGVAPSRLVQIAEAISDELKRKTVIDEVRSGTLVDPAILTVKSDAMKPARVFYDGESWDSARMRA